MIKSFAVTLALSAAILALVTGCAQQSGSGTHVAAPGEQPGATWVNQAPPPPPEQAPVPAPGPEYAYSYIPGYWTWQGQWVWANGTWIPRPSPHTVWVPGKWVKRGHHYIWIRGSWQ